MRHITYLVLGVFVLGLATLGLCPNAIALQSGPPRTIHDEGQFFSTQAKEQADEKIAKLKREHNRDLVIETLKKINIPESVQAKGPDAINKFVTDFAARQFNREEVDGVYILISKEPAKFRVHVGKNTVQRLFTYSDEKKLEKILEDGLRRGEDEEFRQGSVFGCGPGQQHNRPTRYQPSRAKESCTSGGGTQSTPADQLAALDRHWHRGPARVLADHGDCPCDGRPKARLRRRSRHGRRRLWRWWRRRWILFQHAWWYIWCGCGDVDV